MFLEKVVRGFFSKGQRKDMSDDTIKSASELAAERAAKLSEADQPAEQDAQEQPQAGSDGESMKDAQPAELQGKIASLREELEANKDKYLRLVAEFDNFRRRNAREYAEIRETAQGKALQGLFPVVDNFERALQDVPAEGDWTPSDPAGFAKGVRLIRDQLRKILSDAGLEEVPGEGTPFDPNLHEALTQMPHDSVPADHVAAVHARGWKKGDKVLRHAQVIVSSGPAA
jgi:molecular chaperone GrpE